MAYNQISSSINNYRKQMYPSSQLTPEQEQILQELIRRSQAEQSPQLGGGGFRGGRGATGGWERPTANVPPQGAKLVSTRPVTPSMGTTMISPPTTPSFEELKKSAMPTGQTIQPTQTQTQTQPQRPGFFKRLGGGLKAGLSEAFTGLKLGPKGYEQYKLSEQMLPMQKELLEHEYKLRGELETKKMTPTETRIIELSRKRDLGIILPMETTELNRLLKTERPETTTRDIELVRILFDQLKTVSDPYTGEPIAGKEQDYQNISNKLKSIIERIEKPTGEITTPSQQEDKTKTISKKALIQNGLTEDKINQMIKNIEAKGYKVILTE